MNTFRGYSILNVKSVDEDQRIIRGTATTPTADRVGDIVEPMGVKYKNPLPLLWQHRSDKPVGTVRFEKPTKDGIDFEARIPKFDEPGAVKDRIDEAWHSVKLGLVRAVSIGFREIEHSTMEDGGWRFISSEVLELSLVTIPANPDATIQEIRSIDTQLRAAAGHTQESDDQRPPAGASATSKPKVVKATEATKMKKTVADQISAFEATRVSKTARMDELMDAAAEKGETLDAEQKQEYDVLEADVKEVDDHLRRLRAREAATAATATQVRATTVDDASKSRGGSVVSVKRNVEPGIIFTRVLGAKYIAYKHGITPIEVAKAKFGDTPEVEMILRAPVAALNTTTSGAADFLVVQENAVAEFLELLRAKTVIDRIPGLRKVPFNIKVGRMLTDPTAYWVGQGQVKPVSSLTGDQLSLTFAKVAGIVVQTEELMKFSAPSSERLVRDGLVSAVTYLVDRDFLDPSKAVDGASPASITNGVTPTVATGTTAAALRADLGTMLEAFDTANLGDSELVLIMPSRRAMRIGLMRNSLGSREFPDLTRNGGSLEGIPVITSTNIVATGSSPTDGDNIIAVNANSILVADEDGVDIDISREASLQVDSVPDSPHSGSTNLRSLWQHNEVAIKAERYITWAKGRTSSVQYISSAKYAA